MPSPLDQPHPTLHKKTTKKDHVEDITLPSTEKDIDDPPGITLPPREEWPPVVRTAIQGQRRVLPHDPAGPPVMEKRSNIGFRFNEEDLNAKFAEFMINMQNGMMEMFSKFMEQHLGKDTTDGSRSKPATPTNAGGIVAGRSIPTDKPEKGQGKGKAPKKGEPNKRRDVEICGSFSIERTIRRSKDSHTIQDT